MNRLPGILGCMAIKRQHVKAHDRKGTQGVSAHVRETEVPDEVIGNIAAMKALLIRSADIDQGYEATATLNSSSIPAVLAWAETNRDLFEENFELREEFVRRIRDNGSDLTPRDHYRMFDLFGLAAEDSIEEAISGNVFNAAYIARYDPADNVLLDVCVGHGMNTAIESGNDGSFVGVMLSETAQSQNAENVERALYSEIFFNQGASDDAAAALYTNAENIETKYFVELAEDRLFPSLAARVLANRFSLTEEEITSLRDIIGEHGDIADMHAEAGRSPRGYFDTHIMSRDVETMSQYIAHIPLGYDTAQQVIGTFVEKADEITPMYYHRLKKKLSLTGDTDLIERIAEKATVPVLLEMAGTVNRPTETIFRRIMSEGTPAQKRQMAALL